MQITIPLIDRLIIFALTWIAFMKVEFTLLLHTLTHHPSSFLSAVSALCFEASSTTSLFIHTAGNI